MRSQARRGSASALEMLFIFRAPLSSQETKNDREQKFSKDCCKVRAIGSKWPSQMGSRKLLCFFLVFAGT